MGHSCSWSRVLTLTIPLSTLLALTAPVPSSEAHRSGCHRWHSCPSDRGTYICGDLGYCSGCPDNEYCLAGQPRRASREEAKPPEVRDGSAKARGHVSPVDEWTCPTSHPIKGNFTTYSGERCIYHVPGGAFYGKTKPERCYATDDEARRDGCRRSRR